jgi:hypothetical protein
MGDPIMRVRERTHDATVAPHERSAGLNGTATTQ